MNKYKSRLKTYYFKGWRILKDKKGNDFVWYT